MNKYLFLKKITKIILLVYIGFGLVLFFFQNSFIYYPDQTEFTNCPYFDKSEKITFGLTRMYFTKRSDNKVIVFYHGNAGRACDRDYLDLIFAEKGYSSIFVEYAGYGENNNETNMNKVLENVMDTVNFLKTKDFTEIIVGGESFGVGPASYHASLTPIASLVLITAYNNFSEVVSHHYPFYPIELLLNNNYTPDRWLREYRGPVSIILAENDEVIPDRFGKKLYNNLQSKQKNLSIIENVGHNTIYNSLSFYIALKNTLK